MSESYTIIGRCPECRAIRYAEVEPAEPKHIMDEMKAGAILERMPTAQVRTERWSHSETCSKRARA